MNVKRFLWAAACFCLLVWAVQGALILLRARNVAEGTPPFHWLEDDSAFTISLSLVTGVAMLICWVGSIYAWARSSRRGFVHALALIMLIFLGGVAGPFYLLMAVRSIPWRQAGEAPLRWARR